MNSEGEIMRKVDVSCPFCGKNDNVYFATQKDSTELKNQIVNYERKFYKCSACDEEFEDSELVDDNLKTIRNEYRKEKGLLTSDEIAEIRKKYGLSQADFSLAIGWGEITVTRYETNQIQDSTYDMILRIVGQNPSVLLQLLEKNKSNFSEEKYVKIKEKIKNCIRNNFLQETEKEKLKNQYIVYNEPTCENGYVILDVDNLNNIIGCLLSKIDCVYKVGLMKMLWYTDYIHFEMIGKSITGLVYERKKMGALPIGNNELLYLSAVDTEEEYYANGNMGYRISLSKDFKPKKVSKMVEQIIDQVVKKFGHKGSKEIVEYMHKEEAYLRTNENCVIPFSNEYKLREF